MVDAPPPENRHRSLAGQIYIRIHIRGDREGPVEENGRTRTRTCRRTCTRARRRTRRRRRRRPVAFDPPTSRLEGDAGGGEEGGGGGAGRSWFKVDVAVCDAPWALSDAAEALEEPIYVNEVNREVINTHTRE